MEFHRSLGLGDTPYTRRRLREIREEEPYRVLLPGQSLFSRREKRPSRWAAQQATIRTAYQRDSRGVEFYPGGLQGLRSTAEAVQRWILSEAGTPWHRAVNEMNREGEDFWPVDQWPATYQRLLGEIKHYQQRFVLWAFLVVNGMPRQNRLVTVMMCGATEASAGAYLHVLGLEKALAAGRLAKYRSYDVGLHEFVPVEERR